MLTPMKELKKTKYATDFINIDIDLYNKVCQIMPLELSNHCPADIYEQDNIPLKDVALIYSINGNTFPFRIIISEIDRTISKDVVVGTISEEDGTAFPILHSKSKLFVAPIMSEDGKATSEEEKEFDEILNDILKVWYRIQVLLLHPRVEVFERKAVLQKLKGKDKITASNNGRKVKYIKHYYITPEDIDLMINGDRHYKRKCLSWYVIGHYREYKNGKKIFIQGYWKGELRALKRNFDERERVI